MKLPSDIFREYDIRGIYPDQINKENFFYYGKGLGTFFRRKGFSNIVIGHDTRSSSEPLTESLIKGIISTGCNVTYTGITVQPAVHFFSFLEEYDASINITASHNSKEYNGLKVDFKNAAPFFSEDYKEVKKITAEEDFEVGNGQVQIEDLNKKYIDYFVKHFKLKNKIKVLMNCMNGTASKIAPQILRAIGAEVIENECFFDQNYPNGVPDPENTAYSKETSELVVKHKAAVGLELDGDADRFGCVDENGVSISSDILIILFAQDVLAKKPLNNVIVYDIKCSQAVEEEIKKFGGNPEMMRTGRTFILKQTLEKNAIFGAEYSGHMFFGDDYFGYDDGIYAACRLLKILDSKELPMSSHFKDFPKYANTPEFQIPCSDTEKFAIVEDLKTILRTENNFKEISTIDGVRVKTGQKSWFLIRAKNTSPFLTLRAEALTKPELENVLMVAVGLLAKYKHLDLNAVKLV